jgi:uncharacterized protein (TIGR02145 family)
MEILELQLKSSINSITNSGLDLEVTVLRNQECRYDVLQSFPDYGLVIINTHGSEEGFLTGNSIHLGTTFKRSEDELKIIVDAQIRDGAYDKLVNGELELVFRVDAFSDDPNWIKKYTKDGPLIIPILVHSKYIENLPLMPNTVILGNMCYSGWINSFQHLPREEYKEADGTTTVIPEKTIEIEPIGKAFINKSPISYYGYTLDDPSGTSRPVKNLFAMAMEDLFIKRLVTNKDSTGIANRTEGDNIELYELATTQRPGDLYFRQYGHKDYSYDDCIDTFTDARDGRVYKSVCLGKQVWMAENLQFNVVGSLCYDSILTNCTRFGPLYPWSAAMKGAAASNASPSGVQGICPKGWHIPSEAEWDILITYLGGRALAGNLLRAQQPLWNGRAGGADSVGFNALPGGHAYWVGTPDDLRITKKGPSNYAVFLSSSTDGVNPKALSLYAFNGAVTTVTYGNTIDPYQPALNASCRCVKD